MSRALSDRSFDVVLFPSIYSFTPVFSAARKIVFIHDIIPEKYPQLTFPEPRARLLWRLKLAAGRRQADAIVTVSEYSRRQISTHFGLDPRQVFVVGEASDPVFRKMDNPQPTDRLVSLGVTDNIQAIVYVGGFGPHKNLEALVRAFGRVAARQGLGEARLILVGEYKQEVFYSQADRLLALVDELGLQAKVIFTGYLPDRDLVALLNLGSVLVLPSWMEGFGLPAVEAAACGCPVIATVNSPLPELLGQGCLPIDPAKPEELEHAMAALLTSEELRRSTALAAASAASGLTWDQAAEQLHDVIQAVAGTS